MAAVMAAGASEAAGVAVLVRLPIAFLSLARFVPLR